MLDALHGLVAWTPLGLPAFLFVITLVVFFHELGHFLVARAFGVKVDVSPSASAGDFRLDRPTAARAGRSSWLPIGGYVKFAGDADAAACPTASGGATMPAASAKACCSFKPLYQRALVAAAGPVRQFRAGHRAFHRLFLHNAGHVVCARRSAR